MPPIVVSDAAEAVHPGLSAEINGAGGASLSRSGFQVGTLGDADVEVCLETARHPSLTRGPGSAALSFAPADLRFAAALIVALARVDTEPAAAAPASVALNALAARVAGRDVTVLIGGPTGTGKEVVARHIHARSPRCDSPLIAVNCAALPEAMLEALLFGHERGAFTGASATAPGLFRAADGGTLLLDEVAELPLGLQAKLLRTLQEREVLPIGATIPVKVDVRIRMSKQEVKEESRESEGSPETRAAQRRMARQAARRALAPAMAEASVVVVNPAHFAVALRYVPGRDAAPIVVAKGRDIIAEAIRDLAGEKAVPILRYPQLTRAIYFTASVGAPIRDDLFAAVAAVLAFVFSLDAAARDQPDVEIPPAMRFDENGRETVD